MATFLTTTDISSELEKIIKGANDRLILMSPYLKVNQRLKDLLEDKNRFKIDIRVVYGKNELQPEENNWLESLTSVRTSFRQNLHAKCYLNEDKVLVSSMNLYEFSQQNNDEMGLLVLREEEPALYEEIYDEAMRIVRMSDELRVTVARIEPIEEGVGPSRPRGTRTKGQAPDTGFCLRCRESIPANAARPYCGRCYRSWSRFENNDYEEDHCHVCGKKHKATMAKPVCPTCYRKHKKWVDSTKE